MVFTLCDLAREKISEVNDKVVSKFKKIVADREEEENAQKVGLISNIDHLNYTPVTKETFGKWCDSFLS